jgi:hypothetical protein
MRRGVGVVGVDGLAVGVDVEPQAARLTTASAAPMAAVGFMAGSCSC